MMDFEALKALRDEIVQSGAIVTKRDVLDRLNAILAASQPGPEDAQNIRPDLLVTERKRHARPDKEVDR